MDVARRTKKPQCEYPEHGFGGKTDQTLQTCSCVLAAQLSFRTCPTQRWFSPKSIDFVITTYFCFPAPAGQAWGLCFRRRRQVGKYPSRSIGILCWWRVGGCNLTHVDIVDCRPGLFRISEAVSSFARTQMATWKHVSRRKPQDPFRCTSLLPPARERRVQWGPYLYLPHLHCAYTCISLDLSGCGLCHLASACGRAMAGFQVVHQKSHPNYKDKGGQSP